jgi:hypothetical protein
MGLTVQAVSFSFALLNRKFAIREIKKHSIRSEDSRLQRDAKRSRREQLYHLFRSLAGKHSGRSASDPN